MTEPDRKRTSAHERLSTGSLARWARACATHPWRVVFAWVGIVAGLIVLVATIGGSLKDEFSIPGSETQKATDLIKAEFSSEQGAVLNIVFAAPEGQRLDTPERKAAIQKAIARLRSPEFKPTDDKAGLESVANPFNKDTFSDDGRIAYAEAQFNETIETEDRDEVVAVEDAVREEVEPAGVTAEFNGEAEFPPVEQGTSEALGLLAAILVLLVVFRTFVAMFIPIMLAITALATAFLLLFIIAGFTDINTITPILVSMIGLGVGIDYSLFIVTRFRQLLHEGLSPADAAAEAGSSAGRAVLFAGITVAISVSGLAFFGLDFVTKLGIGSALGVVTTVLIANSLLLSVLRLLGHKIDRLKVPFLRPVDDSEAARDKTLIARWGRFVTANARFVFPAVLLLILGLASTSLIVRLGAADQGTQPKEQTSRRAYDLLAEGFGAGFNGPIPIVVDVNGDTQAPERIFERRAGSQRGRLGPRAAAERREDRRDRVRDSDVRAAGRGDGHARRPLARRRRAGGDRGQRCGCVCLRPDGRVQGHRRSDLRAATALPALHRRRHLHRPGDGVPIDRGLRHRRCHDAHVRVRRLRRARARGAGGSPARADGTRQDGADRDLRPADCLRDPLRALDGLHGLPHEPHPRGARSRPADA